MTELRWWTNGDATDAEYKLVMRNNIINIYYIYCIICVDYY